MLSMLMWKTLGVPVLESISTSFRKPSTATYVLFVGIGFLFLYLVSSKCAWMGKVDKLR